MPNKNLTDAEIIKALEDKYKNFPLTYNGKLSKYALDLIIRLQAENKDLQDLMVKYNGEIAEQEAEIEKWQGGYMTQKQEIANLEIELKAMRGAANSYKSEVERLNQNLKEAHIDIREHLAEIERLNKELLEQKIKNNMLYETAKEIEIKANKEFAERLKEKAFRFNNVVADSCVHYTPSEYYYVLADDIDNLLNELAGENNVD